MGQITTGVKAILSVSWVYDVLQNIMGAKEIRTELVTKFIRPAENCRVLDIGCGTGIMLPYLPDSTQYWGYDVSRVYIEAARKQFGSRGHFYCGILTQDMLAALPKFDLVLAIGVLHHLEDDEVRGLFGLANEALKEGGRMVTLDPCLADGQNPIARYLIQRDRGQNVREADVYSSLAKSSFANVSGILRHRKWVPYTHWIMECTK